MKTTPSLLTLALGLLLVNPAFADNDAVSAREHYSRATTAYDLGKFAEAAREFEQAYRLKNDPALLFNIAQAYRFDGRYQQALFSYRAFLRRLPAASNRRQVETSMTELQEILDKQKASDSHPPTGTLPPARTDGDDSDATQTSIVSTSPQGKKPLYKKWWLWTTVGGVVAVGLGVGLGLGLTSTTNARTLSPVGGGL